MDATPAGMSESMQLNADARRGEDLGPVTDTRCPVSHVALTAKIASKMTPVQPSRFAGAWRRKLRAAKPRVER
jgi:hypothetical protein